MVSKSVWNRSTEREETVSGLEYLKDFLEKRSFLGHEEYLGSET